MVSQPRSCTFCTDLPLVFKVSLLVESNDSPDWILTLSYQRRKSPKKSVGRLKTSFVVAFNVIRGLFRRFTKKVVTKAGLILPKYRRL